MTDATEKTAFQRLSPLQRRFVDLIVCGYNGTEAFRTLRPRYKRPDVKAAKWRAIALVREAIDERRTEAVEDAGVINAQVLIGIARIANVNPKRLVWCEGETWPKEAKLGDAKKLHELDDETARSIDCASDGEFRVRSADRLAAQKLLGQYKRMFTETHQIDLGEKTIEQLVSASWKRPQTP
jgi:hypothetical protein